MKQHPLCKIIAAHKSGETSGIYSCCSANAHVLKAALLKGKAHHTSVLIEATANQVDQYGGYTGMKPVDFYAFVQELAKETGIDNSLVILGGDHLGPLTFSHLPEEEAMKEACELVRQYVLAGFSKIHLDTSMRLFDDDQSAKLSDETIARRGAALCLAAEHAYQERKQAYPDAVAPVYIIGSEVPIPGGAQEHEDGVSITSASDCVKTIDAFQAAFLKEGLADAYARVIGIVVQPGVEFGDAQIIHYNREKARDLTAVIKNYPNLVFEGHSTDYQTPQSLRNMAEDGIVILKVGPALTFALREAYLALENIEKELFTGKPLGLSRFRDTLEAAMLKNPKNWIKHYHGSSEEQRFSRMFSFSDRARYYLNDMDVDASASRLLFNLSAVDIPLTLISQYMPMQYQAVNGGRLKNDAESLLMDRVGNFIDDYLYATGIL